MKTYYRLQAKGQPVLGHTSTTSNDALLDEGYVFAYSCVGQVVCGLLEWGLPGGASDDEAATFEIVEFHGEDEYDPGDAEGIAVFPSEELRRVALADWLREHEDEAAELVERYAA